MNADRKWAIVTGASSGIGKALACEFAAGGFNLFLTGRDESALRSVASECSDKFGSAVEIVPADLSEPESLARLIETISSSPHRFECLVNNAGFGIHGDFASSDIEQNIRLLNVQLTAALRLSRAVLPSMISRNSGRILNVGSVYSFSPVPFQSVYSACKAFLLSFSSSLENELKGTGVGVTVFCPGITQTEFRARAGIGEKRKDSGMTARDAAHVAYVEAMRGTAVVVPGWANRLFVTVMKVLPASSAAGLARLINRQRGHSHTG